MSRLLGISTGATYETRRQALKTILYKIQIIQTLGDHDNGRRTELCPQFADLEGITGALKNVWLIVDETHLYLNGVLNKQST